MAVQVYGEPLSGDPFHDRRRTGVGGSDTGPILGISPWSSRLGVWEDKRGLRAPTVATERMLWGKRLEDAVLRGYGEDHGIEVARGRFRRHPTYPFVIGNPDGYSGSGTSTRLVEVKVTDHTDDRWGEPGSADVPLHYGSQVQHYLLLTGLPVADLTALVRGSELRTYTIEADPSFHEALLGDEADFWKLVREGTPPEPDGTEDAGRALRVLHPKATDEEVVATSEVNEYAARYLAAAQAVKEAEADRDRWGQLIQSFMGARGRLVGDGFRAVWPNVRGSTSWKAVAAEALTALQLIASSDDEQTLATIIEGARDTVEAWDATVERHRGATSRRFTLTPVAPDA